jgi:hypothetical protein
VGAVGAGEGDGDECGFWDKDFFELIGTLGADGSERGLHVADGAAPLREGAAFVCDFGRSG